MLLPNFASLNLRCSKTKYFIKGTKVLNKVSFNFEKSEIMSLLDNSGSGKSTLLRIISGLVKPVAGSIMINDEILSDNNFYFSPEKNFTFKKFSYKTRCTTFR